MFRDLSISVDRVFLSSWGIKLERSFNISFYFISNGSSGKSLFELYKYFVSCFLEFSVTSLTFLRLSPLSGLILLDLSFDLNDLSDL
jgi:hypothetical protein